MREERILRKIRSRDPVGLQDLMDCYIPYVSAVVWNILRFTMTPEDAEEVVSDVFLAAWNQAEDIKPGYVKPWLASVARHKALGKLRDTNCLLPLEEDILELPAEETPEARLEQEEEARLVRHAIDTMGEPDREIFLRHYYHIQTVQEISACMHMNVSTVKTRLRRGRMRLKEVFMRWGVV